MSISSNFLCWPLRLLWKEFCVCILEVSVRLDFKNVLLLDLLVE